MPADPAVVLRPRRGVEDAAALAELSCQSNRLYSSLAPELFGPIDEAGFVEFIASDADWLARPDTFALVAEIDAAVAGYLEASILEPDENARYNGSLDARERRLYINFLVTAETHKRRGVGRRLVEAAEDWAREQGVSLVLLDTYAASPQSVPFWEHGLGYERRAIVFRKRLD